MALSSCQLRIRPQNYDLCLRKYRALGIYGLMNRGVHFKEKLVSENVLEYSATIETSDNSLQSQFILVIIALSVTLCFSYIFHLSLTLFIIILTTTLTISYLIRNLYYSYSICEESILIIQDFGLQLKSKTKNGYEKTKFYDKSDIEKVFIHEYIQGSQVSFCLAFMIRNQSHLSLLFSKVYPGLASIQKAYLACCETTSVDTSNNNDN